ncbi:MAG: histidine phosphatase family protein [Pseudonocardiales bacterium]|nr:MAG: histidine phosphatase family protein [Pseudonocardiales bacterium]
MIEIVYETHSITEDNEHGLATGWLPGRLSALGRTVAAELGERRRSDGISAVFTSDLGRATETAAIAFAGTPIPVLHDWRLRECDYGALNGAPVTEVNGNRRAHLEVAYPGGESWRQAVSRAGRLLGDLPLRWDGRRVLVIGHVATRWALDHFVDQVPLERLVDEDFAWRAGWEYRLGRPAPTG